jgi:hypothetical protein
MNGSFSHKFENLKFSALFVEEAEFFELLDSFMPLFQTNLLPDFIHVNFFPDSTTSEPNLLHFEPGLVAAVAID